MIHHSDTTVKPIIGNKDIEIHEEATYNKSCLPFDALTAEEFSLIIDKPESEEVLSTIYQAIVNKSSLTYVINILSYFETIITQANVAN